MNRIWQFLAMVIIIAAFTATSLAQKPQDGDWTKDPTKNEAGFYFVFPGVVSDWASSIRSGNDEQRKKARQALINVTKPLNITLKTDPATVKKEDVSRIMLSYFMSALDKATANKKDAKYTPLRERSLMLGLKASALVIAAGNAAASPKTLESKEARENLYKKFNDVIDLCKLIGLPEPLIKKMRQAQNNTLASRTPVQYLAREKELSDWYDEVFLAYF